MENDFDSESKARGKINNESVNANASNRNHPKNLLSRLGLAMK